MRFLDADAVRAALPMPRAVEVARATFEALAAGIPSVITKSGIANDLAVDGKNCLVVPHRDSKAIGRAIDRLLGSAALRSTLSAAAIASVQTFEIEPMAETYVELLRRLDGAHQTR